MQALKQFGTAPLVRVLVERVLAPLFLLAIMVGVIFFFATPPRLPGVP